ncbi:MAG: 50S ribosomal protein L3, partial [Nanoarchaeota archaeon]|nr:50S ribosomal protein L3 [Nanoarchaeota archaeon]
MPKIHRPRRGSLQFWPRVRSRRQYARVKVWPKVKDLKLLGFAGYKVGMTHVMLEDNNPKSLKKGLDISCPVTVIECPPIKVYSIRFYKKTNNGFKVISEIFSKNIDKNFAKKTKPS